MYQCIITFHTAFLRKKKNDTMNDGKMPLAFVNILAFLDILKDDETFTIQVPKKLLQVVRDVQRGTLVKLEKRSKFF